MGAQHPLSPAYQLCNIVIIWKPLGEPLQTSKTCLSNLRVGNPTCHMHTLGAIVADSLGKPHCDWELDFHSFSLFLAGLSTGSKFPAPGPLYTHISVGQ